MVRLKRFWRVLRGVAASIIWLYVIIKLFVYDIDVYLFDRFFPGYRFLLGYKFFAIVLLFLMSWQIFGLLRVSNFLGYVVALPGKWLLWKIPVALYSKRGSLSLVLYLNSVISAFRRSKVIIFQITIALLALFLIIFFNNALVLYSVITVLTIQLVLHYISRISLISNPLSYIFITSEEVEKFLTAKPDKPEIDETAADISSKISVLIGSIYTLRVLKDGIRHFTKKSIYSFYVIAFVFTTYILVVFDLSLMNIALNKIDPTQYSIKNASVVSWAIYSAKSLVFNDSTEIAYVGDQSRFLFFASGIFGVLVMVLLFGIISGIVTERNKEGLESYIVKIDGYDKTLTMQAITKYNLDVDDIAKRIEEFKGQFDDSVDKLENLIKNYGKSKKPIKGVRNNSE